MNQSISPGGTAPEPVSVGKRVRTVLVSGLPWVIIAGLLYAGLFVKPHVVSKSVTPPPLERRDRLYGVTPAADGKILLGGSNGKILLVDGDRKIQRQTTPTEASLQDIASFDAEHAVAVGNDNVILRTEDGGQKWAQVEGVPRSQVANKLNRVRAAGDGLAVATGEMGALFITRDYGKSWARLREEEDVAWNDVAILHGGVLVVVGESGRVLRSEDEGKTWKAIPEPVPSSLMAVSFRDDRNGVAVGLEGVLLTTDDAGRTWKQVNLSLSDHLFDVTWNSETQQWFAVGALGRWIAGTKDAKDASVQWKTGILGERVLTWHTRVLARGTKYWLAGADVGVWDHRMQQWSPLK